MVRIIELPVWILHFTFSFLRETKYVVHEVADIVESMLEVHIPVHRHGAQIDDCLLDFRQVQNVQAVNFLDEGLKVNAVFFHKRLHAVQFDLLKILLLINHLFVLIEVR
jgi:hypothetical protein